MIFNPVSTSSVADTARYSLQRSQSAMAVAQKELGTGRHADIGLKLGAQTGQTISLRQEFSSLQVLTDTNRVLTTRLEVTQSALGAIAISSGTFLNAAVAGVSSQQGAEASKTVASNALRSLVGSLNTAYDGSYLFAGINTNTEPVADYFGTPPGANKQSVDSAFFAAFGISQDDPAVENITAGDMELFLDGAFSALFDPAAWTADWSSASDDNLVNKVSQAATLETSVNANEETFRNLAKAFTMIADLGIERMNEGARRAVFDRAMRISSDSIAGLNQMQAGIGVVQQEVGAASDRMSIQIAIMERQVAELESVDPTEVSVRIAELTLQIEASYALSARLLQMSLLDYL